MKKVYLLLICFLMVGFVKGQVIVNLQLPPLGLTIKSQLWNLSLINTTTAAMNIKIEMIMTDASNSQQVISGISNTFSLPVGAKQVLLSDVSPIIYTVINSGYNQTTSQDGFLPVGVFNICYSILRVNTDAPETLNEECETIEVEPISPPQLIFPGDSDYVEISRPMFTWLPPTPYNVFNNLLYDWILVEVMEMQSPADAIQQNIPILTQQSISVTSFQYPLALSELDTAKRYAWRVTAKNNSSPIANSEIWTFRIMKSEFDTSVRKSMALYAKLRREEDASYIICDGVLRYEFFNELNSNSVDVKIYDITTGVRKSVSLDSSSYKVAFGPNFMELDLKEYSSVKDRHLYLMEVMNSKNEKWYLKFEYRKPD